MHNEIVIKKYLSKNDKVLARLITKYGFPSTTTRKKNTFDSLVSSVISQQLSSKVSGVITRRLVKIIGRRPFKPEQILHSNDYDLRNCGMSFAKIKAIKGLANEALLGNLDIKKFRYLSDNEVIDYLSCFWGVGKWTSEMFLMFTLKRLDILPLNDAGLNRAHGILYPSAESFSSTAELWKPYRTIGCWYMWKFIDNP